MNKSGLCPNLELIDTSSNADPSSSSDTRPDLTFYSTSVERDSLLDWSKGDGFVEWKALRRYDGYRCDAQRDDILDSDTVAGTETRGQVCHYAARIMESQNRLFVLSVGIYGERARLYRFDPSCIVVSEVINYRKDPAPLVEFFVRFSALSPAERGHDPTFTPANTAEKSLFWARTKEYLAKVEADKLRKHPEVATLQGTVFKVQVNHIDGTIHHYLACRSRSVAENLSPCGRLTRGFIATPALTEIDSDTTKGRLFWLKDCWRNASCESETSIYFDLRAKNVPNLPDVVCAGDVKSARCVQETENDTLNDDPEAASWRRLTEDIRHMIHHRIVSGLLIPLENLENAKDLLLVGRDVLCSKSSIILPSAVSLTTRVS